MLEKGREIKRMRTLSFGTYSEGEKVTKLIYNSNYILICVKYHHHMLQLIKFLISINLTNFSNLTIHEGIRH